MKKNRLLVVLVVVLAAIAAWFLLGKKSGTISEELRDFAVADTGSVTRIFMADKQGNKVLLEKQQDGKWLLNSKHWARPDGVRTLLQTMHDVEVRSPVAKAAYNNIIKSLATKGIKVEVYSGDANIKTYYVGGPTQDQYGTFMYLENSTVPFVTHIPGFDGYLTPRYIIREEDWIVKNVFNVAPEEVKELVVTDSANDAFCYSISQDQNNGDFVLRDKNGNVVPNASHDKIYSYLQYYAMLNYESTEKTLSPFQRDSIRSSIPFKTIKLTKTDGTSQSIVFWKRPITDHTVNRGLEDGTPFDFDVDRMTATMNGDTALIVVQYFSFGKLFKNTADFRVINQ